MFIIILKKCEGGKRQLKLNTKGDKFKTVTEVFQHPEFLNKKVTK